MITLSISNLRKDIYSIINQAFKYNESISINTKAGNVVILSEENYYSIIETQYITSIPGMKESLLVANQALRDDFIDCNEVTL